MAARVALETLSNVITRARQDPGERSSGVDGSAGAHRDPSPSSSASTNSPASNGRRSSSPSPTPMNRIGSPRRSAIASTTPPARCRRAWSGTIPVTPTASLNCARLRERVLTGGRVEHEQRLVRRARGRSLADTTRHTLASSSISSSLGVQAARRVGDQHVGAARLGRVPWRRRRPRPSRRPCAAPPPAPPLRSPQTLQLLDGGGAEGVAGGEHHGAARRP